MLFISTDGEGLRVDTATKLSEGKIRESMYSRKTSGWLRSSVDWGKDELLTY